MADKARYRVLYFIVGSAPNDEQRNDIAKYGPHATFRNAQYAQGDECLEFCTAVCGDVPAGYAKQYPQAVTYLQWLQGELPAAPKAPVSPVEAEDGSVGFSDALNPFAASGVAAVDWSRNSSGT